MLINDEFDQVFSPASTQEEIFEEIEMLVQSAVDGCKLKEEEEELATLKAQL